MRSKKAPPTPPPIPLGAPLMTLPQVAQHCGSGLRTVQSWRASGALPVVMLGTSVRVEPSALAEFLARRRT